MKFELCMCYNYIILILYFGLILFIWSDCHPLSALFDYYIIYPTHIYNDQSNVSLNDLRLIALRLYIADWSDLASVATIMCYQGSV